MTMSNREITALEREAKSREELARAINSDKGKKYLKAQRDLEKAAGGKKKLDQADKILADAEAMYEKRIAEGQAAADKLVRDAEFGVAAKRREYEGKMREAETLMDSLEEQKQAQALRSQEQENAALALQERENRALERESELSRRETDMAAREREVELRETKQDDLDKWAAARPG